MSQLKINPVNSVILPQLLASLSDEEKIEFDTKYGYRLEFFTREAEIKSKQNAETARIKHEQKMEEIDRRNAEELERRSLADKEFEISRKELEQSHKEFELKMTRATQNLNSIFSHADNIEKINQKKLEKECKTLDQFYQHLGISHTSPESTISIFGKCATDSEMDGADFVELTYGHFKELLSKDQEAQQTDMGKFLAIIYLLEKRL